jgi:hypothetical protein
MNVQIYSNTPNKEGGTNYNNEFTMTLPEQIDAENEKKTIRVLNVTYPLAIENVEEKSCGIRLSYLFSLFRNDDRTGFTSAEVIKYETAWMYLPPGFYTLEKMLNELNKYVNEYDMYFMTLSGGRIGVSFNVSDISFIYRYNDTDNMASRKYLIYDPLKDINFEMSKDLKYMLGLETWRVHPDVDWALFNREQQWKGYTQLQIILSTFYLYQNATQSTTKVNWASFYGKYLPDMTNGKTRMFIYCNEVVPTIVGNTRAPLLASLKINTESMGRGDIYSHDPSALKYELVNAKIKHLHIRMCDIENNLVQFSAGTVGIECVIE